MPAAHGLWSRTLQARLGSVSNRRTIVQCKSESRELEVKVSRS